MRSRGGGASSAFLGESALLYVCVCVGGGWGVCLPGVSALPEEQTPHWTEGVTHACENIPSLASLSGR